jgi:hypothetical protein
MRQREGNKSIYGGIAATPSPHRPPTQALLRGLSSIAASSAFSCALHLSPRSTLPMAPYIANSLADLYERSRPPHIRGRGAILPQPSDGEAFSSHPRPPSWAPSRICTWTTHIKVGRCSPKSISSILHSPGRVPPDRTGGMRLFAPVQYPRPAGANIAP